MRAVVPTDPPPRPDAPSELMDRDPIEAKAGRDHASPAGEGVRAGEPTTVHARRRVLLVAPQAFFSISGTPINIYNMCKVLTEIGYEVHLATLPLGETVAMPGLIYHRVAKVPGLSHVPIGFSFAKLVYDLLLAVKMIRLLRKQPFAVIHSIEDAAFFAAPIAHRFQTPTISDLDSDICGQLANNSWPLVRGMAYLARPLLRLALRRSTCALTVADSLTRLVQAESPKTRVFEVRDIPGEKLLRTADPEATERLRQELDLPKTGLIVYTGNFDWRQGVETLIEAMPLVVAQHPNSLLLLVGGEPRKIAQMRQMAKRLGVEHAVRLIGKRPIDEMPEFMAMASVLASPRLEPYVTPLKIYGYMASGRPIVATDLPTHTEVLDLNSSILAPPDAPGLADGIVRALNEPARSDRLGLRAKQLVEREHTYEAFKAKLADAYKYVVAVGGAGGLRTARD